MTIDEIYSNIRYNENLIDSYYAQRRRLEQQINELENLRNKFSSLQNRFCENQDRRRRNLNIFRGSSISNQIVQKYGQGMSDLLNSAAFFNAENGLSEARSRITRKIYDIDSQIDECDANRRYRENRRAYWIGELHRALEAQEG